MRRRKIVKGEGREEEEKENGVRRRGVVALYPGHVGGEKHFSLLPHGLGMRLEELLVHGSTPLAAIPQVSLQNGQRGKATVGVPGPPGGHPRVFHTLHLHQQGQPPQIVRDYDFVVNSKSSVHF